MKSLKEYRISYSGLKLGKHQFEYDIDDRFFDEFEYSLVKKGNLKVELELDKQETMLILQFKIKGNFYLSCDVCLSDMPVPVELRERQIVKFSDDEDLEDNTEEIIVLGRNEHEVDLSTLIYEYITLAVPFFNRCEEEGGTEWCDKDMIDRLKALSGGAEEKEEQDSVDPRWAALKNIKK